MGDITRLEVIEYAKEKRHELIEFWEDYKHENREVRYYDFIINSLETDEAYQLEYERTIKPAHWIGSEYDGYADGNPVYTTYRCSNCGAEFQCEDMDFEYCPRCGSLMEVET